jgi:hypothetical protein
VDLGRYLCEVWAGQYWRLEKVSSFDDFLEKRFSDSRRKAYYLMAIHENLTRVPKEQLREIGWTKATELAKVARREGGAVRKCNLGAQGPGATQGRVQAGGRAAPTGKETEAWEIIYFKPYKSQLPVVEKAIETAGLMLGTDKSRGYCLEMICANFLAGASASEAGVSKSPRWGRPDRNRPKQTVNNAATSAEATPTEAQYRRIRFTSPSRTRTRWVAMSKLRFVERFARAPSAESESPGRRQTGQPNRIVLQVSQAETQLVSSPLLHVGIRMLSKSL